MSRAAPPTKEQILEKRLEADLTPPKAAALIHASARSWQQWEAGDRQMHPAFFELFLLKAGLDR